MHESKARFMMFMMWPLYHYYPELVLQKVTKPVKTPHFIQSKQQPALPLQAAQGMWQKLK